MSFNTLKIQLEQLIVMNKSNDVLKIPWIQSELCARPSRNYMIAVFLLFSNVMKPEFSEEMMSVPAYHISYDHTFYIATLVRLNKKVSGKISSQKQFKAVVFFTQEDGCIKDFQLTRTERLTEIKPKLMNIFKIKPVPKSIASDLCCKDGKGLKRMGLSDVKVYLDVFHALDRVKRTVKPKGPLEKVDRIQFKAEVNLIVRRQDDRDGCRQRPTTNSKRLKKNINLLLKKWKNKGISNETIKALRTSANLIFATI